MSSRSLARRLLLVVLLAVPLFARQRPVIHPQPPPDNLPADVFSYAEPADVRTTHLSLDLDIDFDARVIRGRATHTIVNRTGTRRLVLDVRDLVISAVSVDGIPSTWSVQRGNAEGDALVIPIGEGTRTVRVDYSSRPAAAGLHWLTPQQTDGDVAPFLYTLGEPDLTRSWIPVQDTPGVRMTWEATVRVRPDLLALMSAPNPVSRNPGGVYTFSMTTPVPAYLIALAAGRVEFHAIGDRTGFYSEPELAAAAAWDLQHLEKMLGAAERVLATYPWPRYDLLLVPPGFVVSGMENPMLNFINAATIAGNHETPPVPSALIAHELAHSWVGDLVTCATWSDTWLNEGFATYFEKRILEELAGSERAAYGFFADREMFESYAAGLASDSPWTILHRQFQRGDVPAVFTVTSYRKGGLFLRTIEDRVGREAFDAFVRHYLVRYSAHWVDDEAFLASLRATALAAQPAMEQELALSEWLYGTGLPANVSTTSSSLSERINAQAAAFRGGAPAASLERAQWTSFEEGLFFSAISDVISTRMTELDNAFGMSSRRSAPIEWWVCVALTRYAPAMPAFERFMMSGHRSVVTVYNWLSGTSANRAFALSIYARARVHYAPEVQATVDQILGYHASELLDEAA